MNNKTHASSSRQKAKVSLIFFFMLFGFMLPARFVQAQNSNKDSKTGEFVDLDNSANIDSLIKESNIPALGIGVIKGGVLKEIKVYGELKKGSPAPYNAIFNVASITKTITTMVTLKLVSSGEWSLDEPLYHYWTDPDIKDDPRSKKLTTRHVLTHQTGFANWRWLNKSKKLKFEFDPGTKYQYSGEGLEYLQHALENKFHETLQQLADSLIFKPLGMQDSHLIWDNNIDSSRFAIPHDDKRNPLKIDKNTYASGADLFKTTLTDYGRFLVWVMNGAGLSKNIFDQMISHQVKTKANRYMGLGWLIYDLNNGEYALSHGGSDEGVRTISFCLPKSGDGIIIFTNSDNGTKAYIPIIKAYLKDKGQQILDIELK